MKIRNPIQRALRGTLALAAMMVLAGIMPRGGHAQISVIVAASSSRTADQDAVARMFSGQVTSWNDGSSVQLVDQSGTATGQQFYDTVIQRSASQVRKALTALLLSGQIPKPEQRGSDAEVMAAVTRLVGSIGYIASASLDGSVKELVRIPGA